MKNQERYTVYNAQKQVLLKTNDIKEALNSKEENKHNGAYIEDRKNKTRQQNSY